MVAEGIETADQSDLLQQLGCDVGQGYYYSMPLRADELHWLLTRHLPLPLQTASPERTVATDPPRR